LKTNLGIIADDFQGGHVAEQRAGLMWRKIHTKDMWWCFMS